jgi:hypothetical protein
MYWNAPSFDGRRMNSATAGSGRFEDRCCGLAMSYPWRNGPRDRSASAAACLAPAWRCAASEPLHWRLPGPVRTCFASPIRPAPRAWCAVTAPYSTARATPARMQQSQSRSTLQGYRTSFQDSLCSVPGFQGSEPRPHRRREFATMAAQSRVVTSPNGTGL